MAVIGCQPTPGDVVGYVVHDSGRPCHQRQTYLHLHDPVDPAITIVSLADRRPTSRSRLHEVSDHVFSQRRLSLFFGIVWALIVTAFERAMGVVETGAMFPSDEKGKQVRAMARHLDSC